VSEVPPDGWRAAAQDAYANGFSYFDWLGCVDEIGRSDTFRIVLVLRDLSRPGCLTLTTHVPRQDPQLDSIASVYAGAGWHERESAELFGVEFIGGDQRRLLLDPGFHGTPLRKDEVLAARSGAPWPGAKEPGETDAAPGRRRMVPPGVPEPSVRGDRDLTAPTPDPAEVAASAVGGRVRRRRS
jgi:NADH-quinone oxidoreductase subunit C